jgi:hypothetical protein
VWRTRYRHAVDSLMICILVVAARACPVATLGVPSAKGDARRTRRRQVVILLCLCSSSCAPEPKQEARQGEAMRMEKSILGEDQRQCEADLAAAPLQPSHSLAIAFPIRFRIESRDSIGNLGGLSWDPQRHELTVLDLGQGVVVVLDTAGRTKQSFGALGNGPGEWSFIPIARSTKNRLAVLPEGLAVADTRGVHWYSRSGKYRKTLQRYFSTLAGAYDGHLAAVDGTLLGSESNQGRMSALGRDERTALTVRALPIEGDPQKGQWSVELRNDWIRLAEIGRLPSQRPYLRSYRRTWDAQADQLAMLSFEHYGICVLSHSKNTRAAFALDIPANLVDARERDRELRRTYRDPDKILPFLNVTARQLFEGKWPSHTPRYIDVTIGDDSVVWALRVDEGKTMADLFDSQQGYLGSLEMQDGRLPSLVRAGLAWFAQPDSLGLELFTAWDVRGLSSAMPLRAP